MYPLISPKVLIDIETTSLEPTENGRVVCVLAQDLQTGEISEFFDLDEGKLLTKFWTYLCDKGDYVELIGFNNKSFDIPYLVHRSLVRRIKMNKFTATDLRQVAGSFFYSYNRHVKGDLHYWAKQMGIDVHTPGGAVVPKMFVEGKYNEIINHCREDLMITRKLYDLVEYCGLLN